MRLVEGSDDVLRTIYWALMEVPVERRMAEAHDLTEDRFVEHWRHAPCVGFEVAGRLAGGMFFHAGSAHIGVLKEFRSRWFKLLPAAMEFGFRKCGHTLLVRVNSLNTWAKRFVTQTGCELLRDDGVLAIYAAHQGQIKFRKEK